jgi:hypothetical protein
MKKLTFLLIILSLVASVTAQTKKTDQRELPNEVYASYGIGSIYSFTNPITFDYDFAYNGYLGEEPDYMSSWGTIIVGYNRMLNHVISVGFQGSYGCFTFDQKVTDQYSGAKLGTVSHANNLLSGIAKINFNYFQSPVLRVYSGFGIGVTVDLATAEYNGEKLSTRKLYPAGQLTLVGLRVGRAVGFFSEFGFGTNGIVLAGLSVQLK